MKLGKRTILFVMSVLLSVGTWAQNMTEQEAAERALQFLRERGGASRAKVMGNAPSQPVLRAAKVEAEKIYAFNVEGGGYVIASGDSRTLPVLGYSDSDSIDCSRLSVVQQGLPSSRSSKHAGIRKSHHIMTCVPSMPVTIPSGRDSGVWLAALRWPWRRY